MKKVLSLLLVVMLIFSVTTSTYASNIVQNNPTSQSSSMSPSTIIPTWIKIGWKILKVVMIGGDIIGDEFLQHEGSYGYNSNCSWVETGSIDFNQGDVKGKIYHKIDIERSGQEIDAFADTSAFDWFDKINIEIIGPGGVRIDNKSVTQDQHFYYEIPSNDPLGTWEVEFTEPDRETWSCYINLWNYASSLTSLNDVQIREVESYNTSTGETKNLTFYSEDGKTYVKPSKNHKKLEKSKNRVLSIEELNDEIFDEELGMYVDNFKNYSVGDTILFKDKIDEIYYDEELNSTIFTFIDDVRSNNIQWMFKGDLTKEYKQGKTVKLKFKVVDKYSDENVTLETIDYIQEGLKKIEFNDAPEISKYIY